MPSFPSITEKKLPKMSEGWGSFVLNELRNWGQLPKSSAPDFEYIEREATDKGFALATVVIGIGDNIVNVPVIIRDWKLCPLDLMEINGNFYPLTGRRLGHLMAFSSPFSKVVDRREVNDIGEDMRAHVTPPLSSSGGMNKEFSAMTEDTLIAPRMAAHLNRYDINDLLTPLDNNTFAQYRKHGTYDVLMGILKGPEQQKVVQSVGNKLTIRHPSADFKILWIPRPSDADINSGFGTVYGSTGANFDIAKIRMPVKQMIEFYSNESGVDPILDSENFVSESAPDGVPITDVSWSKAGREGHEIGVGELDLDGMSRNSDFVVLSTEKNGDRGNYNISNPGKIIKALHSPSSAAVGKGVLVDYCKLLTGDRFYGAYIGNESSGMPVSMDAGNDHDQFSFEHPDQFLFTRSVGDRIEAFGPVCITAKTTLPLSVAGETSLASEFTGMADSSPVVVTRSSMFKDIVVRRSPGRIEAMLPADFTCMKLNGILNSPSSPGDVGMIAKLAREEAGDWVTAWSIDGGTTVCLDMPEPVKVAYQRVLDRNETGLKLSRLSAKHAEFVLMAAGMRGDEAVDLVKAAADESITAYGVSWRAPEPTVSPEVGEKIATEKRKLAKAIRQNLAELHLNGAELFKRAAELGERKTVDAVLGLGMANEQNVDELIDSIPRYEEVLKDLSEMLKDARVAGGLMREEIIQKAMIAVENFLEQAEAVVASIRKIRSTGMAAPIS